MPGISTVRTVSVAFQTSRCLTEGMTVRQEQATLGEVHAHDSASAASSGSICARGRHLVGAALGPGERPGVRRTSVKSPALLFP